MKILLLSGYDAASHRHWYHTIERAFSDIDWTILSLPARYFSWRVRGNSLSWAFQQRETLQADYDLLIATSMVDLSALRGFVPELAAIPTLVYFHENQFSYPESGREFQSVEPAMLNLYTGLAADRILFNSAFNRTTFLQGCNHLLAKLPDQVPAGLVAMLEEKSTVLPVPLGSDCFQSPVHELAEPLTIVWNHRWEYDKGPEQLRRAITGLLAQGCDFRCHVVGQQFRQQPPAFADLQAQLQFAGGDKLGHWGYVEDKARYRQLLAEADIVLSTALHDFQGLSVLEGVAAGAVPVVPARLCYPEWFDQQYCYPSMLEDPDAEAAALATRLAELAEAKRSGHFPAAPDVSRFAIEQLQPKYDAVFREMLR